MRIVDKSRILEVVRAGGRQSRARGWSFGHALMAMALGTACAAGSPGGKDAPGSEGALPDGATAAPPVRGIEVSVEEVRLSTAPVDRYGTPVQHALTPAEAALSEALAGPGLRHDPGLSRAARELARTAPDRTNVPGSLIAGVTAWVGLVDPPPRLAISELPAAGAPCGAEVSESCGDAVKALAEAAREAVRGLGGVWYGVGVAALPGGDFRLVIAIGERGVAIDPIPNELPARGKVQIRGRLLGKRSDPAFVVFDPQGRVTPVPVKATRGEFSGEFVCSARGAYQVEVLAEGAYGPEVVANFPLYCGTAAPRSLRVEVERVAPGVVAEDIARANFAALNDARQRQGLKPLQWDNKAAAIARGHSEDMVRSGFVGHNSPTTGDVEARFKRAGLAGAVMRENVARGYGPWAIHQSLMHSPGHRVNILADDVTHVGIGAVFAPPETDAKEAPRPILLTQNFYSKLGADAPVADMPGALRQRVDALRARQGLRAVAWNDSLSQAAQLLADGIAAGSEGPAQKQYDARLETLRYKSVATHRVLAPTFASIDGFSLWSQAIAGDVGVGVAKVERGKDAGSLIAVVAVGAK
jgi:uncharacterized protein YkwD